MVGKMARLKNGHLGEIYMISYSEITRECLYYVRGEDFLFGHTNIWWDEIETWW